MIVDMLSGTVVIGIRVPCRMFTGRPWTVCRPVVRGRWIWLWVDVREEVDDAEDNDPSGEDGDVGGDSNEC